MVIATSRSHHSLEILSKQIGTAEFFAANYAADDVENHKPAPDLALLVLEKHGVKPQEAMVIGDTVFDLQMGKAAGCKVCGVTWGNQTRRQLESADPDFIIDDITQLPGIL